VLRDLHIRNLAVVEEATIELGTGFNVLSGETGAGKSIVVDSLALLAGVRASSDQIRTGADKLGVSGIFEPSGEAWRDLLVEAGIDAEENELMIRREVSRNGRSRAWVNDRPVTLKLLTALAPYLLRIHGQREELGLVDPELQRTWLDRCGGEEAGTLRRRTREAFAQYRQAATRLERLIGDEREREERLDLLRFQLAEIDDVRLVAGEEDGLRQERAVLRHSEAIQQALADSSELLFDKDGAAYVALSQSVSHLQEVSAWEPQASGWVEELEELRIRLGELETPLRHRLDQIEADPHRLNAIEDRLATLERLFRKHGATSAEVLTRRDELAAEIDELTGDDATLAALRESAEKALASYRGAAEKLSHGRRRWSKVMAEHVSADLEQLALAKARFTVELEPRRRAGSPLLVAGEPVEFSDLGWDHVVFHFSPNPGEELHPLSRVASGGELSRLYLAVQLAARGTAAAEGTTTLVFDEVDAGISGAEAATLGARLRRLGRGGQVLAVTHLPQVASQADAHFKVSKEVAGGRTRTRLACLGDEGRVEEVARMLAGSEITELSLSHARELIVGANA
jgi:DNA repair protein RecN (Recombination protein N)